jgi:hypothetical protein
MSTNISEEHIVSIFRVEAQDKLLLLSMMVYCLAHSSTLKMEAVCSSGAWLTSAGLDNIIRISEIRIIHGNKASGSIKGS